ncbi:MAG: hypothetical protein KF729_30945 [Sandaracinaceae bacterium]|nr:hypothetical protein [Sandaracinaceae bacterium]
MPRMRLASRSGALALAVCVLAFESPLLAQECIVDTVQRSLSSCAGVERASPRGPGRAGPRALAPSQPARPGTAPARPSVAPPSRAPSDASRQHRVAALIEREREVLDRLLARMDPRDPQRAEVLARLASTLDELARIDETRARALDEPIFLAQRQGPRGRARALAQQRAAAEARARDAREAMARTLVALVQDFPSRPRADETLLSLALTLEALGQGPRALQVYHRLLREHPQSRFVPHAYLAFAERAFSRGALDEARQFYERVLTIPAESNELYGYALYKLAWVRHDLEDFAGALDAFVRVLEHTRAFSDRTSSAALARQSRRELVLPYARAARPDRALAFFRRVASSEDEAREMFEALAHLYFDMGRWPETIRVHQALMALAPGAEGLCGWQARVLDATIASRPKPEQVREARRLADVRATFGGAGHAADAIRRCDEETASALVLLATAWHREAVGTDEAPGTRDRATMEHAAALYELVGARFPDLAAMDLPRIDRRDRPSAGDLAFFHGELLYALERWPECARAYERAVERDASPQLVADAAYGAVLCHDRHLGARPPPPAPADRALAERAFTDDEARMARTFARFACVAPEHEELPIVLYRWARLHYEANQLERAAVLFRRVALHHARSEVGEYAANLYLDALNALGERRGRAACFAELERALEPLDRAHCGAGVGHPTLCALTAGLRCQLGARRAVAADVAPADRARRLLALARDGGCLDAPALLYDAAIAYEQARLLGAAIRVRTVLVEQYPGDPRARRALALIGANYHALAIYELAADWYERYAREGEPCDPSAAPGPCPDAADALRHAVTFRLGLGQRAEALAGAELFQRRFARAHPALAAAVSYDVGALFERAEDWPRLVEHYRAFLRRHGRHASVARRAAAHVAIARGLIRQGQRDAASRDLAAAAALYAGAQDAIRAMALPPEAEAVERYALRDAVAEARYEQAEGRRLAFEALRFPALRGGGSIERVNQWAARELLPWIERKQALIREAEAAYALVAPLGVPRWRIAAASRLGDMYLSLVTEVRASPVPDVIARYAEALEAYERALDEATEEPAAVAIERYQSCLATATDVRWFDERSRRCERALHQLDAAHYPLAVELRGAPSHEPPASAPPGPPRALTEDG